MEFLLDAMTWIGAHWELLLSGVGFFALIATVTPNTADDKIAQKVLEAINFLGANLGKSANKDS